MLSILLLAAIVVPFVLMSKETQKPRQVLINTVENYTPVDYELQLLQMEHKHVRDALILMSFGYR